MFDDCFSRSNGSRVVVCEMYHSAAARFALPRTQYFRPGGNRVALYRRRSCVGTCHMET